MSQDVILTGAGGGIGNALLRELLARDPDMHILGIWNTRKPTDPGLFRFSFEQCDLTDSNLVGNLADCVPTPYAIINLAGQTYSAMSWKGASSDDASLFESNVLSAMNMCRAFIPGMRKLGRGRIINVSSIVAHTGAVGASSYAATKGALEAFTRSLALEVAPKGITANCIALGYMETGMIHDVPEEMREQLIARTPLKRFGKVSELAELITYLLLPESEFMTGQTLHLNGGLHLG